MTYYEWIQYIESLKEASITNSMIQKLDEFSIDYPLEVRSRYLKHIVGLIEERLDNVIQSFIRKVKSHSIDKDTLLIEINMIKQEIVTCKALANNKLFDSATKEYLFSKIKQFGEKLNVIVKEAFQDSPINEIVLLVNNLDFNN